MATLVLGTLGSAVGNALLPAGLFGGLISGSTLGGFIGAQLGNVVDNALLGPEHSSEIQGPRLTDLTIQASTEGAPIMRIYGRSRVGGQVIWATKFKETETTTTHTSGGKASSPRSETTVTEYTYSISFAVGLAEGKINRIGRVWADGKPLDLSKFTRRLYKGTEWQFPDSVIEAVEGAGNAPAYRGLAYIVFEDMPLEQFGNRVPQLSFEIIRSLNPDDGKALENSITAVDMIPSSGEFAYTTDVVVKDYGKGQVAAESMNNNMGAPDFIVSLDALESDLPQCEAVALVVSWFGDDLRCDQINIKPGVELSSKTTTPLTWSVNGVQRGAAHVVSQVDGRPAFGGTPTDDAIVQAIQELKGRGLRVLFYPFILMDIPSGNSLSDPYTLAGTQAVYPWRGRITCDPAPGVSGSPDKTASAATHIASFFGGAATTDFSVSGTQVSYTGAAEWGLRRMILHYAHLCQAAGGVDAFLIGSELRGLTTVRDSASTYPATSELQTLASDVSSILTTSKISYAADWSEYFGHQPDDGSNDVFFHLDDLWADSNIDFIGVDYYVPLSDWRDGVGHLDYSSSVKTPYELSYLKDNVEGGEGYDWYYDTATDRINQTRTAITDGSYNKPWVFRYKDLKSWWQNSHYHRPGGTEDVSATAWVPESKSFWLTEVGCPAVDKGSNRPNLFIDPKSSESAYPHFSNQSQDDLIQRRYLEAVYHYWKPSTGNNPTSSLYSAEMIDHANIYAWTWDARPFPDFPARQDVWTDGGNWQFGHWLTGRVGQVPLSDLIVDLCAAIHFTDVDVSEVNALVTGFILDRIMSPRDAIEVLALAYMLDVVESDGTLRFLSKGRQSDAQFLTEELVAQNAESGETYRLIRAQETELPVVAKLRFIESHGEYLQAATESRRLSVLSDRTTSADVPIVFAQPFAQAIADSWLMDAWMRRERAEFALPPSQIALDPGDNIHVQTADHLHTFRLAHVTDTYAREVNAVATEASIYDLKLGAFHAPILPASPVYGPVHMQFMDLPILEQARMAHQPYVAATASPWPGTVSILRSATDDGFILNTYLKNAAVIGETVWDFYAGPTSRWDHGNVIQVDIAGSVLENKDKLSVLNGANAACVQNGDGAWEVFQFLNATLISDGVYELSGFLRGQLGTERAMRDPVAAGAPFVLLNDAVTQLDFAQDERGLLFNYAYGPAGRPLSDFSFQTEAHSFQSVGLRPFSPVHVRAIRDVSGDVTLSWVRRTRLNGDSWQQLDVPLNEENEAYEIDILSGETVKRTLSASMTRANYTSAQEITDFGATQSTLKVRVSQLSTTFGRGSYRENVLNV